MKNSYKLVGKVKDVNSTCYVWREGKHLRTQPFYPFFYGVVYPYALPLQFGAKFPWGGDIDKTVILCRDNCKVSVEIKMGRGKA